MGAATLVLHLLTNTGYNFFRDEFYYIACGHHLAWGYVDHPPLIGLVAAGVQAALGESLFALRLLPALAGAVTVALCGVLAGELGARRFGQALSCVCALVAPVYLEGFTLFTMNAFDFLFWTLLVWILVRILRGADPLEWLWFGLVAGVGLLNKHSVLFLLAGVFVGLILTRGRRHFATPWPWAAGAIAIAIVGPHLAWQVEHGWPTLEFIRNAQAWKIAHVAPWDFLLGQFLIQHPLTAPIWIAGLAFLLFSRSGSDFRALGWIYLALFALFAATSAKLYYLSPIYPILWAAGGVWLEEATDGRRLDWLRAFVLVVILAGGVVTAPVVLPVLEPERLESYMHAIHLKPVLMERHREPRLTQTFADEFGWEDMVAKVARAYHALPPAERARCAIYASNYGEAGAIDFYGRRHGLPHAISGHNNYWLWGPDRARGEVAITVGESEEDVGKTYRDVRVVDRTSNRWAMPYENDVPIIVGRGPKNTLLEIWDRCKKFI